MTSGHPGSRRRRPRFAAWGGGALLAGCLLLVGCQTTGGGSRPAAPVPPTRATGTAGGGRPVSIQIPAIGVDARVVPVGLGPNRSMEVPAVDLAGWYEPGPRPGAAGPAVIVGHVDSRRARPSSSGWAGCAGATGSSSARSGEGPGRSRSRGSSGNPSRRCPPGASGTAPAGRCCA